MTCPLNPLKKVNLTRDRSGELGESAQQNIVIEIREVIVDGCGAEEIVYIAIQVNSRYTGHQI